MVDEKTVVLASSHHQHEMGNCATLQMIYTPNAYIVQCLQYLMFDQSK